MNENIQKKKEHQEQGLVKQNQNTKKKQMKIAPLDTQFEVFPFGFNLCSKIFLFLKKIISPIQPKKDDFLQSKIKPPFANRNNK